MMLAALSKEILNPKLVNGILNNPIRFPTQLIEKLSLATALKYWNGQMSYREGDCIANNLFIYWTGNEDFKDLEFSDISFDCYLAFDAGEYYHEKEDRSIDPSEKYTRPLVEGLLRKRNLI
jgi:hypothetical protein